MGATSDKRIMALYVEGLAAESHLVILGGDLRFCPAFAAHSRCSGGAAAPAF